MQKLTHRWVLAATSLVTVATNAYAQGPLLDARQALGYIIEQGALPSCPDTEQLRLAKDEDAMFLYEKLSQAGWETVGKEYLLSLNDLADGMLGLPSGLGTVASCGRFHLLVRDLHVKREDCEALGHSRTDIPVEISTSQGTHPFPGLEVYARWLPAGDRFSTVPKRLRDLSSPARGSVPVPGEFEIFAKDPSTGQSTTPERVSIGGQEIFKWPLPVNFPNGVVPKK